tara:strand:+ start:244 stop:1203 length:960 start_codon:yes stop_codon:yes gene_type:complete
MYTSKNATREFALKAAAATERAMERHACCKSQFKFKCFSCGEFINRGDNITRCIRAASGMKLRYRGADADHGLTMEETIFYQGETGKNLWVHTGCIGCFWDQGLDEDGNRLTRPALRPITTEWGVKVYGEFEEWANADDSWGDVSLRAMGVPYFCMVKGYPKEKFMRDRIVHAVTRFQALWRGYIYKKAYPIARLDAIATRVINEAGRATLSTRPRCTQNARKRNQFLKQNSIGAHVEILFDENHPSVAVYSGEVIKIQGLPEIDGLYFWVKYHHDHEVRRYHWRKLKHLKLQCEKFKSKHGIEAQITGRLPLYKFFYP